MSKSGLFAHFGSKEELQLSTVRAARRVFYDEAIAPALAAKKGIERLEALVAAWHGYIAGDTFEGGCLLMEASAEFDNRPGPVRDLIAETMGMWMGLLVEQAERALERGELAPGTDPRSSPGSCTRSGSRSTGTASSTAPPSARERRRRGARARLDAAATGKGRKRLAKAPARLGEEVGVDQVLIERRHEGVDLGRQALLLELADLAGEHRGAGMEGALEAVGVGVADGDLARHAALAAAQEHPPGASPAGSQETGWTKSRPQTGQISSPAAGFSVAGDRRLMVDASLPERGRPAYGTTTSP